MLASTQRNWYMDWVLKMRGSDAIYRSLLIEKFMRYALDKCQLVQIRRCDMSFMLFRHYQLLIAYRQLSKLAIERLSGLNSGTSGTVGCNTLSWSIKVRKLPYRLYTVHAWNVSCWTQITITEYGVIAWHKPKPATSTVRDISQARELLGRYGAVGGQCLCCNISDDYWLLQRLMLYVTYQVLRKIGNCGRRDSERPSYQFNAVSYHPQQKAEEEEFTLRIRGGGGRREEKREVRSWQVTGSRVIEVAGGSQSKWKLSPHHTHTTHTHTVTVTHFFHFSVGIRIIFHLSPQIF